MAVDYRDTLITYLRSEDVESAASSLNITKVALMGRLSIMRKHGVNIPKKRRPMLTSLDVAQLNSLIKKFKKESEQ